MTDELVPIEKQVLFEPFPKQEEFIDSALSGLYNFIVYGGAIRGGKTFALLALFIVLARIFPGSRWALVRKDLPTIKRNLYPSWNKIKPTNFISSHNNETHTVTFKNGSQIIFFPENYTMDKELDRWKGLEVNGFGFEEINECQQVSLYKAFERAGTYVIPNMKVQPPPIVVGTRNPTRGWLKQLVYDRWKKNELPKNWLYIQSKITDNIPFVTAQPGIIEKWKMDMPVYEYQVFVDGDWDVQLKTGNEFLRGFELDLHVKPTSYTPGVPVCISIDSNVYPYIAITCWQLIGAGSGWIIRQIHELPASDPENTASQAGKKVGEWLRTTGTKDKVYLYGDYSTKASNNIDDSKRSFFQIVEENIKKHGFRTEDKLMPHVPVSSLGDFINAIFKGEILNTRFEIGEHCKKSINDYIQSKTAKDGTILKEVVAKTPQMPAHQKNGHLVDTLKDLVAQAFAKEYKDWQNSTPTELQNLRGWF